MDAIEKIVMGKIMPAVIAELILDGIITESSCKEEVLQAVISYLDDERLETMNAAIVMGDRFEQAVENAVHLGQKEIAIALAGIVFEQMTNEFYLKILLNKYELSNREYMSCMKGSTVKDKLTWLYKLTTSRAIEPEVVSDVQRVCGLRNNIVHYKPKIKNMGEIGKGEDEDNENEDIDINKLLPLIERVKEIFSEDINRLFPEERISKDIFEKTFGSKYIDSKSVEKER